MGKKSIVTKISYGIFGSIVDLLIWQVALLGASVGKTGSRGVYEAFREADDFLEEVNHKTLASAWYQLTKKRLVTYKKRNNLYSPQITEFGRKRLLQKVPYYHTNRPWDKKIYLVTYDIPEVAHKKRDIFRFFLIDIGCRLLAESTWLTPYNPRELINDYIRKNSIPGTIIVSDIGQDGGVGETNIEDLLVRLYSLEKINDRYQEFMDRVSEKNTPTRELIFEYLAILKGDPQLPFDLLPNDWLGSKAYLVYQNLKEKYILNFRGRE